MDYSMTSLKCRTAPPVLRKSATKTLNEFATCTTSISLSCSLSALRARTRERTFFLNPPLESHAVEATTCSSSSPGRHESGAEYFESWDVVTSSANDDLR